MVQSIITYLEYPAMGDQLALPVTKPKRVPKHPIGRWECQYPGCQKSGIGYIGKKACGPTHRSFLWRREQAKAGRVRTRYGYRDAAPIRIGPSMPTRSPRIEARRRTIAKSA